MCRAVSVVLSCVASYESLVYSCLVMDCVVRLCWFGCLLVVSVIVVFIVLLHLPYPLHTDVVAVMLSLAFFFTSSLGVALRCLAAVFLCIHGHFAALPLPRSHALSLLPQTFTALVAPCVEPEDAGCFVCTVRGYRRACTTMAVAMRAFVGFK